MEVHRCRFITHVPAAVVDIAPAQKYCAVLRGDSSIDVYQSENWVMVLSFPGHEAYGSKKVRWLGEDVLVTCGAAGVVCVWKLTCLSPVAETTVPGGGIWGMAFNSDSLVLACDDGQVRVYTFAEDFSLDLHKTFHKQPCKMLDVAWPNPDVILSCGSDGGIYKWTPRHSTCQLRIANTACVWTLAVLNDDQVASGDSEGCVKVWETQFGTLIASFHTHEADVLTLCFVQSALYSSGIDSRVVQLRETGGVWRVAGKCRGQSHDVHALAGVNGVLVSGGVTTDLCLYPEDLFDNEGEAVVLHRDKVQYKGKAYRHVPAMRLVNYGGAGEQSSGKIVVSHCAGDTAEVWVIDQGEGEVVKIASIVSKGKEPVTATDVSPNGKYVSYSTLSYTRLFKVVGKDDLRLDSVALLPGASVSKLSAKGLFLGYTDLKYVDFETLEAVVIDSFPALVTHLVAKGTTCAVRLFDNSIKVYKDLSVKGVLPQLEHTVTALGLSCSKSLYLSTDSNLLLGFNLKTMELDPFSKQYSTRLPKNYLGEFHRVIGIHFFETRKNLMLLHTHYSFTWVDLTRPPPRKCEILTKKSFPDAKLTWSGLLSAHPLHSSKPTHESMDVDVNTVQNFAINRRFGPILQLHPLEESVCLVELPWEDALSRMPQPLAVHKYGS